MTIKIASSSPSLTLVEDSGGVRFVVHAFLTSSDFIFWWDIRGDLVHSWFYGKDFVDALTAIRNAGGGSAVVRYVWPGNTPAEDIYSPYRDPFTIFGERLSKFAGKHQVVNLAQNGDDVTMTIPVTATETFNLGKVLSNAYSRVIDCLQDAARGENNALCSFSSWLYNTGSFLKE